MSYTALYRKFRPGDFRELVGQEHITKTLQHALATGRIVHAYLFCGPRGTGKTSTAKILAQAVNCEHPDHGEPCGQCDACKRIKAGQSLDIMEIDAASNRGIDEIRDLRERVRYAPAQEKMKVYIIDEVHMLTNEAFNALLKTLEEPPAHVMFILATTEAHKIPLTVLSRCQRFDFRRISLCQRFDFRRISLVDIAMRIKEVAEKEQISITAEAVDAIAKKAEGGLRDAMSLLDQCVSFAPEGVTAETVAMVLGAMDGDFIAAMAAALYQQNVSFLLQGIDQLVQQGKDLRQFLQDLLEHFRSLALFQLMPDSQKNASVDRALQQGPLPDIAHVLSLMQSLGEIDYRLRYAVQPRIVLELSLLKAALPQEQPSATVSQPKSMAVHNKGAAPMGTAAEKKANPAPQGTFAGKEDVPPWEDSMPKKVAPSVSGKPQQQENQSWEEDVPWGAAPSQPAAKSAKPVVQKADAAPWDREDDPFGAAPTKKTAATPTALGKQESRGKGGAVNLDSIKNQWQAVLTAVRKQQITTYAFLREGKVAAFADNKLWLAFPEKYKIHMEAVLQPKHKEKVEEVLAKHFGMALTVQCGLEGQIPAVTAQEQQETALPADWVPPEEPPVGGEEDVFGAAADFPLPVEESIPMEDFTPEPEEEPDWQNMFDGIPVEEFDD